MEPRTVIRARSGADFLSYIPHQIGYVPHDCVVAVAVSGPRGRVGVGMRLDLAHVRHPEAGPDLAEFVASHMVDDGARGVIIVRYSGPDDPPIQRDVPVRDLAAALARRVEFVDVWEVGLVRYQHLDPVSWRPKGESGPVEDLQCTQMAAACTVAGSTVAPSREEVAPLPRPGDPDVRRAQRAALRAWDARTRRGQAGVGEWRATMLQDWQMAFDIQVEATRANARPPAIDPKVLGRIAAMASDGTVRDTILESIAEDATLTEDLAQTPALGYLNDTPISLVDPRCGIGLDEDRAEAAERLLTAAVAHASRSRRGHLFGILAWIAWTRGDGVRAAIACDRAAASSNDAPLADLVEYMVRVGLSPRRPERAKRVFSEGRSAA